MNIGNPRGNAIYCGRRACMIIVYLSIRIPAVVVVQRWRSREASTLVPIIVVVTTIIIFMITGTHTFS